MGAYNESAPMMRGIVIWLSVLLCMYRIKQIERGQAIGKLSDQTDKKNKEQKRRI